MASNGDRTAQLRKFLGAVAFGKQAITTPDRAKRFLEAICAQTDPAGCVERLFAKQPSLEALRQAIRIDTSSGYINDSLAGFLRYISNPAVKQISNGQLLHDMVNIIVDPPTLWNTLVLLYKNGSLNENATFGFAWLLLELLLMPSEGVTNATDIVKSAIQIESLIKSGSHEIRVLGYKIHHLWKAKSVGTLAASDETAPGGRHDNDFADYRKTAIFPTADEFLSDAQPFYRRAKDVSQAEPDDRVGIHLDNQFRLLREDMLAELRDDVHIVTGKKKGKRSPVILEGLCLAGITSGEPRKWKQCALKLHCTAGMEKFEKLSTAQRKTYLKDNPRSLKHQSFGCLFQARQIVAFAVLDRDENGLLEKRPALTLKICEDDALERVLLALKGPKPVDYIQVDTAFFAYEPILRCLQSMFQVPLAEFILGTNPDETSQKEISINRALVEQLRSEGSPSIQHLLKTEKSIDLDQSQMNSLVAGLERSVSLIQGPPGTGKSFIGALIAKAMVEHTEETILVLSYTNHALDQFLEDLLDNGIPEECIVRLGSKSSPRTASLSLFNQQRTTGLQRTQDGWDIVHNLENVVQECNNRLATKLKSYITATVSCREILAYLEFSDDDDYYSAFVVPIEDDGMTRVGEGGKEVKEDYLLDRWSRGLDAGIFRDQVVDSSEIWAMNGTDRAQHLEKWRTLLLEEQAAELATLLSRYNRAQGRLSTVLGARTAQTLKSKRIIGCTTTAAAKYASDLGKAAPGIVLVEEAGEILESHILTALSVNTKQLILIGDHKQLRPKYNNYAISVEKGNGYDFNRSLFERLVLANYPHTTLSKQHRMCPEISSLIRHLTYPDLADAEATRSRTPVLGIRDRVVFFNHDKPEVNAQEIADRRDPESKTSKSNLFEVELVLKCVRYLGQQGYGTDKLVILTPYLGQLRLLRDRLMAENDPILNDLDSYDLIRAGLISQAGAALTKRPIKIATIDNYQGEESEIVIVSLTRSNKNGDIGFMFSAERLNVMLSRARNGLIMIGNAQTFLSSRRADLAWKPFLDLLKNKGHLYDGLPIQCQQHPEKKALLRTAEEFEIECPDGGCSEPCGILLNCGAHSCPSKCHQLYDHSKMECQAQIQVVCPQRHKTNRPCSKSQAACRTCSEELRQKERIKQRNAQLDAERDARRAAYAQQLAEEQAQIKYMQRSLQDMREAEDSAKVLEQQKQDLADLKQLMADREKQRQSTTSDENPPAPKKSSKKANAESGTSTAEDQWEHMKRYEYVKNKALDDVMGMIGLEDVKSKFLAIKIEVDTAVRQGLDMSSKRFGVSLLGNPGTGKTTVARLYAKFLTSVGALPGNEFIETTGAAIANAGISGCQKKLEIIQSKGGGALFIDEAYQLASGNHHGGAAVLDYILAEVENLTGKVVFILAGYNKQMEKFFAHNPGFPSRFPHELQFKDYEDGELLDILIQKMDKRYNAKMKMENGTDGLFARIVARRVGRGRGREGFGNARDVENTLSRIASRQAFRLQKARRAGKKPDDFLLTKADLLGPEPTEALNNSKAWKKLQSLIGLSAVKQAVKALFGTVQFNYQRELDEAPLVEYSLNKVFLGSPGTGKTTVAKLYGQILADIGFLSNGELVVKNPSDFVGNVLGASESTTNGILDSTVGKVLLIDEAYGLNGSASETSKPDSFKTAVVDTIVAKVQSVPGDDRCVLLAGYKEQMEDMFQKVNPGLSRRFPLGSAFVFEDFNEMEMANIFDLKLSLMAFTTTDQGKRAAMEVLRRTRNRPNFGNAGEIDILLDHAKAAQQKRINEAVGSVDYSRFESVDFDEDFDRAERADTNVRSLFKGVIGCEKIVYQLESYQITVRELKAMDMDPTREIPFNFLFRGPPGTGKTSTARKMGKVFYDMGFLSKADVVECSATDLIGSYVGHTGPKVQKVLENALGRVLFIDEAYRLGEGRFAKEAMDEIVDCLTKPKFAQKLIVILAGYDDDINRLLGQNPGLTSRFPESINFAGLKSSDCLNLLIQLFKDRQADMQKKNKNLVLTALEDPSSDFEQEVLDQFDQLSKTSNWANARDVQTIAKNIFGQLLRAGAMRKPTATITEDHVFASLSSMLSERTQRQASTAQFVSRKNGESPTQIFEPSPPHTSTNSATTTSTSERSTKLTNDDVTASTISTERDPGVSDAVWEQLQRDTRAAEARDEEFSKEMKVETDAMNNMKVILQQELRSEQEYQAAIQGDKRQEELREAKRLREEARLRNEAKRRAQEEHLAKLERERRAKEEEQRKEKAAQRKLQSLGVCPVGYRWIKQNGGYRCAGGSHFVTAVALGL